MPAAAPASIEYSGRCLCGAVRFVAHGNPRWVAHCHCESCRRATSAPMATYAGFASTDVDWSGDRASLYRSSPGVERTFCAHCGSPMSYAGDQWPGETHLFVASFADPAVFVPTAHVHVGEQLPWLHLADALPRFSAASEDGPAVTDQRDAER